MFSALRTRFGIPGVISVIALVFAMLGGAYAASDDGGDGKATASAKKAKKGPRGPRGPRGPQGAQGPKGDTGAAGAPGLQGLKGATGATGPAGADGSDGETGATGATGPTGDPWTAGGTLPVGATQTGTWAFGRIPEGITEARVPISFSIPLAADLPPANVHYMNQIGEEPPKELKAEGEFIVEVTPANCSGTAAAPTADSGHLCVYTRVGGLTNATIYGNESGRILKAGTAGAAGFGASTAGAYLNVLITGAGARGVGTWAVTG